MSDLAIVVFTKESAQLIARQGYTGYWPIGRDCADLIDNKTVRYVVCVRNRRAEPREGDDRGPEPHGFPFLVGRISHLERAGDRFRIVLTALGKPKVKRRWPGNQRPHVKELAQLGIDLDRIDFTNLTNRRHRPEHGLTRQQAQALTNAAAELQISLSVATDYHIRCNKIDLYDTFTDGAGTLIGFLPKSASSSRLEFACFLDRSWSRKGLEPAFWHGIESHDHASIRRVAERLSGPFKVSRILKDKMTKNTEGYWSFPKSVPQCRSGEILLEIYTDERAYLGYYEFDREQPALEPAIAFFNAIVATLELPALEFPQLRDSEGRKSARKHTIAERSTPLAAARKRQDGYVCYVCRTTMVKKYGNLGLRYAEAHHVVPLKRLKRPVVNSVDDLITVCPNCHRMLHRMSGNADDKDKLRKMLNR